MRLNPRTLLRGMPFRARLALAFSTLFLLTGAALLTFVVLLARYGTARQVEAIEITKIDAPSGSRIRVHAATGRRRTFGCEQGSLRHLVVALCEKGAPTFLAQPHRAGAGRGEVRERRHAGLRRHGVTVVQGPGIPGGLRRTPYVGSGASLPGVSLRLIGHAIG
ncbi:hypothetical protein SHIRM173S_12312 [Streptomyces hirsutus]